ncbi:hypothetical protein, partial [Thiolapillus sp.]
ISLYWLYLAGAKQTVHHQGLNINPATKYVALSASNRTRIKARLAGNGKPLSKAATPIRVLFEAPDRLIMQERPPCLRWWAALSTLAVE